MLDSDKRDISTISNPDYFEEIFRKYFEPLTFYAMKLLHDQDSAKEMVHTVFINLWERKDKIHLKQPIKSYLYTSVHNRCLNFLRDKSKFVSEDAGEINFLHELSESLTPDIELLETESRINNAINRLPEKCRQIFKLNRFEEKKYHEIANYLNISVKTVEGQMSRALRILREELKDYLVLFIWLISETFW